MDYGQPQNQQPQTDPQPQPQTQPQSPPSFTPAPEETPRKKRFNAQFVIIAALSILLLVAVGALGYVLMNQDDTSSYVAAPEDTSEQKTGTDEVAKEEVPEIKDEYKGWNTFPQDAQNLFDREIDLAQAFSFTESIKTEFKFPSTWKHIPMAGDATCRLVMGNVASDTNGAAGPIITKGGAMCIGAEIYYQDQSLESKVNSLVASGDWVIEGETKVDGVKAIKVARIKNIPPDAGGKIFYTYVDNIRSTGYVREGTVVGCSPSGEPAERESFMKECNLAISSINFL